MPSNGSYFSECDSRILKVLSDGQFHSATTLKTCLADELSGDYALGMAITRLRKKLRPFNQFIHCVQGRGGQPARYIHLAARGQALIEYDFDDTKPAESKAKVRG